jgi:uncharacterized protein YjbI with pentapeptide repeats
MAESSPVAVLKSGVDAWNAWRRENPAIKPDLSGTDLSAEVTRHEFVFQGEHAAPVTRPVFRRLSDLNGVDFSQTNLTGVNLTRADLRGASLAYSDLTTADLSYATLTEAVVIGAIFNCCRVHGLSAWELEGEPADQQDLVITKPDEATLTVDQLAVAQLLYLLLDNERIQGILETVTAKVVLILGRFTDERKAVLEALRAELRNHNLAPVMFDFDKPLSKDMTGTVETLAQMARFIVADLTDPSSVPHELATIVPSLRTTPVVPLRLAGSGGYGMFVDLAAYPWVLPTEEYPDAPTLIASVRQIVVEPAERKVAELREQS